MSTELLAVQHPPCRRRSAAHSRARLMVVRVDLCAQAMAARRVGGRHYILLGRLYWLTNASRRRMCVPAGSARRHKNSVVDVFS